MTTKTTTRTSSDKEPEKLLPAPGIDTEAIRRGLNKYYLDLVRIPRVYSNMGESAGAGGIRLTEDDDV